MGSFTTHVTLLERLSGEGSPSAWREFYDRYGPLIRGFARRRGAQPADCDEVVQEVLTALTKAMPGFEYDPAKGKFRSYLKTVAMRALARKARQKRGDVPLEDDVHASSSDSAGDEHWEEEWRQYHLRLAMKTIAVEFNAQDRAAFEDYALRGRDAKETADALGLSIDQVYQAKSRILKRMTQLIELQVKDEG